MGVSDEGPKLSASRKLVSPHATQAVASGLRAHFDSLLLLTGSRQAL